MISDEIGLVCLDGFLDFVFEERISYSAEHLDIFYSVSIFFSRSSYDNDL